MKKNKIKGIIFMFFVVSLFSVTTKAYAITNPTINAYQQNNVAKIELGIDIEDSDILNLTSFESGQELPEFRAGGNTQLGNQSISGDTSFSGSKSIKLTNTLNFSGNN